MCVNDPVISDVRRRVRGDRVLPARVTDDVGALA